MAPSPTAARPDPVETGAFYEALQAFLRVYQFRDRDRACYGDLTPNDCHALEAVAARGAARIADLATDLGLHKSNASRIASGLVDRGYLSRDPGEEDGRSVRLCVTPLGRARHAAVRRRVEAAHAAILARYPASTRRALPRLLDELRREAEARIVASGGGETSGGGEKGRRC
jgi:DNA-binding MarR family transcriptional regulator